MPENIFSLRAFLRLTQSGLSRGHDQVANLFCFARNRFSTNHNRAARVTSIWAVMTPPFGQPGFFQSRATSPWLQPPGAQGVTSYYDSGALRDTLERLIDFDLLMAASGSASAQSMYEPAISFISIPRSKGSGLNTSWPLAHFPPALPAAKIEREYYWDGGIVSNTPLQYLLERDEHQSSLVFQVDLFSARGALPARCRMSSPRTSISNHGKQVRMRRDVQSSVE